MNYVGEDNAHHLINSLKEYSTNSEDWKGGLYCGINLKWDYDKCTLYISTPGYTQKQWQKYKHQHTSKPKYAPYPTAPRKYRAEYQETTPQDTAPPTTKEEFTLIQQVVGSILYYARVVDLTVITDLSTIANEQAISTKEKH